MGTEKTKVKFYLRYKCGGSSIVDMSLFGDLSKEEILKEIEPWTKEGEIVWLKKNGEYLIGSSKSGGTN